MPKTVLIIAYACEPNKTSEPGVGWNFSKEIANFYDTIVLTRANNKEGIESAPEDSRKYMYYDLPAIFKILKKKLPLGTQFYYMFWQWGAYMFIRKFFKDANNKVDAVHHLTFGNTWISPPSFLLKKKFIWGPIGGGDFIPYNFLREMGPIAVIRQTIYYLLNQSSRISPFSYNLRHTASAVIFRTKSSYNSFANNSVKHIEIICETASPDKEAKNLKKHSEFISAICVGRLIYGKGFIYAVKGFHQYLNNGGKGQLEILGDGAEYKNIKNYIDKYHLSDKIIMRGFVDNNIVKETMNRANILMHPSFSEGGSWAIMEAMSFGLPVICLDASGPKDMVTPNCGALLSMDSPEQLVKDIAMELKKFSQDEKYYLNLSKNAQDRIATQYTWDKRGEQIASVYKKVLEDEN